MLWFWLAAMAAGVLALLLWPLLRAGTAAAPRRDYELAVYRRQLAELEAEAAAGRLPPAALAEARRELERRALAAGERAEPAAQARPSWRRGAAVGLVLAMPAAALALYLTLGAPALPGAPWQAPATGAVDAGQAEMTALVARLAARLAEAPEHAEGWRLLGRSYWNLGRFAEAAAAFQEALKLRPTDLESRLDMAEAMTLSAGGQVTPAARVAFEAALAERPENARARFYLGLADWQAGQPQSAYERWLALARAAPPQAPWLPRLKLHLLAAGERLGLDVEADLARPGKEDVDKEKGAPTRGAP